MSQPEASGQSVYRLVDPPPNVHINHDVVYGTGGGRELHLDLFLPAEDAGEARPGIVFVHGGGWQGGTREQFHRQAAHLAAHGYVGACIEYRLSGEARYPAAIEDAKCAVRWLRAHAGAFRVDCDRIGACGGSAGGHLVALLGTTDASLGVEGDGGWPEQPSKVNLVIDCNGVADMAAQQAWMKARGATAAVEAFLGGTPDEIPDVYAESSPLTHVAAASAPFLLLHGTADDTVPISQSEMLYEKLRSAGVTAELERTEGAGHGFFNREPYFEPALARMHAFLDRRLRRP